MPTTKRPSTRAKRRKPTPRNVFEEFRRTAERYWKLKDERGDRALAGLRPRLVAQLPGLEASCRALGIEPVVSMRSGSEWGQKKTSRRNVFKAVYDGDGNGEADRQQIRDLLTEWAARSRLEVDVPAARSQKPVIRGSSRTVVIGHGRSDVWRALKDYVVSLGLTVDEYSAIPTAGLHTVERLEQMLAGAGMAFLVMTGEDQAGEEVRARQNVVHEAGLFQGKLGFKKAIILLEDGCAEFSNIAGLQHIKFSPGDISTAFHKVQQVLLREGMLKPGT